MKKNSQSPLSSSKRRWAIISAIAAGSFAAAIVGFVINSAVPRTSFAEDILHPPRSVTVAIPENAADSTSNPTLSPQEITVVLGINNTVVWVNNSPDPQQIVNGEENAPSHSGEINGLIRPGGNWAFTFTQEGNFEYQSENQPWLTGIVVVKAPEDISSISGGPARIMKTSPESDEIANKDFDIKDVGFTSDGHPFISVYGTAGGTKAATAGEMYGYAIMVDEGNFLIQSHTGFDDSEEVQEDSEWHAHTMNVFQSKACKQVGMSELVVTDQGRALVSEDKVALVLDPNVPTIIYEVSTLRFTATEVGLPFDRHLCVNVMGLDNMYLQ